MTRLYGPSDGEDAALFRQLDHLRHERVLLQQLQTERRRAELTLRVTSHNNISNAAAQVTDNTVSITATSR